MAPALAGSLGSEGLTLGGDRPSAPGSDAGALRCEGAFATAHWDEQAREGILAADRLGSQPLYYRVSGGTVHFASELRDLFAALPATPAVDAEAVGRWLVTGVLDPSRTLYEGIHRLDGGTLLRVGNRGVERRTYWRPAYREPERLGREEAAAAIRAELERSLRERTAERRGIMLSGGLDSSSLAGVIHALDPERDGLRAYSAVFPEHSQTDESSLVAETAAELGISLRTFPNPGSGIVAAAARHAHEWLTPLQAPNVFFQAPLLEAAREDGVDVMFDGEGGDELFGCAPFLLSDHVRRLRLLAAKRLVEKLPGVTHVDRRVLRRALRVYAVPGALPHGLHALRHRLHGTSPDTEELLRPALARRVASAASSWDWTALPGPRWWAYLADLLTKGRERLGVHDHLRRNFATYGLVGAHPFLDEARLVELVLRLPPELAFDASYDRPLLREAVSDVLPEQIRRRRTKTFFDAPMIDALAGHDLAAVENLLDPVEARVVEYARPDAVRSLLATAAQGGLDHSTAWALARLLAAETWLRAVER